MYIISTQNPRPKLSFKRLFKMIFHNVNDLKKISDEQKRRPSADQQWWLNLVHMQRIMSKYTDSEYTSESEERLELT